MSVKHLTSTDGSARPYKVFNAMISQTGTAALTLTVLENTIGEIVSNRGGVGSYELNSSGLFTLGKTYIPGFGDWLGDANLYMPLSNDTAIIGWYTMYTGSSSIGITVKDATWTPVDLSTLIGVTTLFIPEVRVYA